jgi:hypothetical protein
MPKNKTGKKVNKKSKKHRLSTFEDLFLGFIIIISVALALFCLKSSTQITEVVPSSVYHKTTSAAQENFNKMVQGYPIAKMLPFIGRKDEKVAAFLVAIAKKESNWGKFTPKKDGQECYNYWGYRGPENPTDSGYSCFSSPKEAVDTVGLRIKNLIAEKIDTPQEMVMWKCGPGCTRRQSRSADKWVRDVGFYYDRIIYD